MRNGRTFVYQAEGPGFESRPVNGLLISPRGAYIKQCHPPPLSLKLKLCPFKKNIVKFISAAAMLLRTRYYHQVAPRAPHRQVAGGATVEAPAFDQLNRLTVNFIPIKNAY